MNRELVLVLDFGSRHNQLIGRKVREAEVYSEVLPYHASIDKIKAMNPKGIIFIGDSDSIKEPGAKLCDKGVFELGVPILGICYGMHLINSIMGGSFKKVQWEGGKNDIYLEGKSRLFEKLEGDTTGWMNSSYLADSLPEGFKVTAR